ncbi:uncharacterized protein [Dermacentor albipictus]|uniref:uncharacterized protein n=1 Tax=Dermacentor albipictus TaxID=60249 RepID=UPI0038FC0D6C
MANKPATVIPGLQQPPPLDFDKTSEWPAWINHFDDYRFATALNERSGEAQVRTLLYTMGRQAREVFATFELTDDEAKSYDVVKQKFDSHFVKERNIVYESACFHRRQQRPEESVDQFATALHVLADRCDFGDMKKRLIRDRFVVGLRDVQLSEALQMDPQLTLATALAKARLKETVRQQQQSLRPEGVHIGSPPELQDQGAIVDAVGHQKHPQHKERRCPYCVGDAHPRSTCPAKASKCHYCGNEGHFAKACLKKVGSAQRKVRVWAVEHGTGETFVGAIDAAGKARYVQVLINSVPILAKVDSGAEVSVLPSTFPGLPTHLDNSDEVLQGAGGNKLNVLGKFVAEIAWKQRTVRQTCYVISPLRDVLLGLQALEALGIVKFADSLTADKQRYETLFPRMSRSRHYPRRIHNQATTGRNSTCHNRSAASADSAHGKAKARNRETRAHGNN